MIFLAVKYLSDCMNRNFGGKFIFSPLSNFAHHLFPCFFEVKIEKNRNKQEKIVENRKIYKKTGRNYINSYV